MLNFGDVWINPRQVTHIQATSADECDVYFSGGEATGIEQSIDTVIWRIEEWWKKQATERS